jgi:hypothetical protein
MATTMLRDARPPRLTRMGELADLVMALVESIPDALLPAGEEGLETVGMGLAEWIGARAAEQGIGGEELAAALDALWPWLAGVA